MPPSLATNSVSSKKMVGSSERFHLLRAELLGGGQQPTPRKALKAQREAELSALSTAWRASRQSLSQKHFLSEPKRSTKTSEGSNTFQTLGTMQELVGQLPLAKKNTVDTATRKYTHVM